MDWLVKRAGNVDVERAHLNKILREIEDAVAVLPAGTVASVSVTTANGVSGSVATATTTPAITITLGAITPSSVAAAGTVTGSNLSGTNTGDQDLSSYATTASVAAGYQPLDADLTAIAALAPANDDIVQRKAGAWTNRTMAQLKVDLNLTGTNSGDQTITLTGDVTGSGTGSFAATIANNSVSLAKMADVATSTVFYRKTAGTGDPEVQTLATLKTDLGLTGTNSGDQTTITGNAGTATTLQTSRTIAVSGPYTGAGVGFDGSANITIALVPSPRIQSEASNATPTPTSNTTDIHVITAQAAAAAFAAPTGSPVQGQKLIIRIKDNGTARALTWDAIYRAMGTALPTITVLGKTLYLGFIYNFTDTRWDLVASAQEA